MGLLTLLSRGPGRVHSREDLFQSHSVSSLDRPGSKRGSNQEDSVVSIRRESVTSKDSLVRPGESEVSAQQPLVTALQTAGLITSKISGQTRRPTTPKRPQREPRKPPLSFRDPNIFATSLAAHQGAVVDGDGADDAGSLTGRHGRTGSFSSSTSRRAKDLLDAVGEIRPVDFRSRVRATGARDFGEDVADRNILEHAASDLQMVSIPDHNHRVVAIGSPSTRAGSLTPRRHTKPFSSPTYRHRAGLTYAAYQHVDFDRSTPSVMSDLGEYGSSSSRRNENRISLNTAYVPSCSESTALPSTPLSVAPSLSSYNGIDSRDFGQISTEWDRWSRSYRKSSIGSNFSVPRSPQAIHNLILGQKETGVHEAEQWATLEKRRQLGDNLGSCSSNQQRRSGESVGHISSSTVPGRYSHQTFRSSLSSSTTSRYPSVDFTPLGVPRLRSNSMADFHLLRDGDPGDSKKAKSLCSHVHSRSNSSDDLYTRARAKEHPSALRVFTGGAHSVLFGANPMREWESSTPCNSMSNSSASNVYSGSSARPTSRHTHATSVDSTPQQSLRKSEDSFLSESQGQHGTSTVDWPRTRTTGFNIDDYISSDDEDSDAAVRRPTAEGEEDLLFDSSFGITGAVLPGLMEPAKYGSCPSPIVGYGRCEADSTIEEEDEYGSEQDTDAAYIADIEDDRTGTHRDLPFTSLRQVRRKYSTGNMGTFGRKSTRPVVWGYTDKGSVISISVDGRQSSEAEDGQHRTLRRSSSDLGVYDGGLVACRGQSRLSALGTLHARDIDSAVLLGEPQEGPGASDRARKEGVKTADTIREETGKMDHTTAMRLRKEDKARKRAQGAQNLRNRRMTRAFGVVEDEAVAVARAQTETDEPDRGRSLVRRSVGHVKGKQ